MRPSSILFFSILSTLASGCLYRRAETQTHFTYISTTGAIVWHKLDSAYALCGTGKHQSPIDIRAGNNTWPAGKLQFDYPKGSENATIENNGHTVMVTPQHAGLGGKYTAILEGKTYKLIQFHFHTPSEHFLNNTGFPLEVHFVHQDQASNTAVVGMFFDLKNQSGGTFMELVALAAGTLTESGQSKDISIDLSSFIANIQSSSTKIQTYSGSLTTPPCTQGVKWYVVEQPHALSAAQFLDMRKALHFNARYVQNDPGMINLLQYSP